ncbi:MAG: sensor histidine kinase [Chloroflexi bacterium]|nr:MAG: sensor histidine kinase [Chloroflexota bacterium]
MGAAVLVTGLLLIVAGLISARIPGGASFARPGISTSPGDPAGGVFGFARRGSNPIRAFVLSPIHPATWHANGAILLGLFVGFLGAGVVLSLASAGLSVLLAGIGVVLVAAAIEGSRVVARIERWRVFAGEPVRPPAHAYRPLRGGGIVGVLRAEFMDESRWRDVVYTAINLPLTVIEFVVVFALWSITMFLLTSPIWYDAAGASPLDLGPLSGHDVPAVAFRGLAGLALLPVAASLSQLVIALHRGVVAGLLCTSEARELRRQVEVLRKSRSDVLDVEASELHRIERDLHDGAQQRLVALTIDLGLASERLDADPAAAKQLILEGQEQAREALAEIRQLVRGIAPAILLDRGLVSALESIIGRGPVPTVLVSELATGARFAPPVERAAYFVVSEALANVAKHSGAKRCEVHCRLEAGPDAGATRLVIEVWDDGAGGARLEPDGGLAGLASRIAGVDGTFSLTSPAGGPTAIRAEIPVG